MEAIKIIFKGEPNLVVKLCEKSKTGTKFFKFDENGFFETQNDKTINYIKNFFEVVPEENKKIVDIPIPKKRKTKKSKVKKNDK